MSSPCCATVPRSIGGSRAEGRGLDPDARRRTLAALVLLEGWTPERLAREFDGDRFRPAPLVDAERRLAASLAGHALADTAMPPDVRGNYPAWLEPAFAQALGRDVAREMAAATESAPLDLRVNLLKTDREAARAALAREGVEAARTPLSPVGLRVFKRIPLGTLETFKKGLVEVQDEGSQLAALLVDARPGMRIVDFCAGAGGKTLALASSMGNRGHLIACDTAAHRLERAAERLRRAGASIVQRKPLESARDKWVRRHALGLRPGAGRCALHRHRHVAAQSRREMASRPQRHRGARGAPGGDSRQRAAAGAAGRAPDLRHLLAAAGRGRSAESERFLAAHDDFTLVPIAPVWRAAVGGPCPAKGPMLRLTPARHGTDGFFVAVLERKPAPAATQARRIPEGRLTQLQRVALGQRRK